MSKYLIGVFATLVLAGLFIAPVQSADNQQTAFAEPKASPTPKPCSPYCKCDSDGKILFCQLFLKEMAQAKAPPKPTPTPTPDLGSLPTPPPLTAQTIVINPKPTPTPDCGNRGTCGIDIPGGPPKPNPSE